MLNQDSQSSKLLIRISPKDIAIFRFLLEAQDNLGFFTVLDKREALLKLVFASESERRIFAILASFQSIIHFEILEWPFQAQGKL